MSNVEDEKYKDYIDFYDITDNQTEQLIDHVKHILPAKSKAIS